MQYLSDVAKRDHESIALYLSRVYNIIKIINIMGITPRKE